MKIELDQGEGLNVCYDGYCVDVWVDEFADVLRAGQPHRPGSVEK